MTHSTPPLHITYRSFSYILLGLLLQDPLTQWLGEDRKTHRVGFADLTEYRVCDKSCRVCRKVTEYLLILTEYLTELFHWVHRVRSRFLFSHRVFGRTLTEFTEFTRSAGFLTEFATEWISPSHCARGFQGFLQKYNSIPIAVNSFHLSRLQ